MKSIIQKMAERGVLVSVDHGELRVKSDKQLNDEQRQYLRNHKTEIIDELQSATVYDLDRHAAEKNAAIKYWRFLHNGVEVDIVGGATLTEAVDLLGCGSDDTLEPLIRYDEPDDDDRRHCCECRRLIQKSIDVTPKAPKAGNFPLLDAHPKQKFETAMICNHFGFTPANEVPRRCEHFRPLPGDPDQRPGRERWPGLDS